ncbi:MAG: DUF3300 domain-containing protein [Opitutaceae bacterium]
MTNIRSFLVLVLASGVSMPAQEIFTPTVPVAPMGLAAPGIPSAAAMLTAEQLEQLLGPIALYPDALIALILPAAASPSDIVLATRYLQAGADPAQADNQPWEESVQALARYPDILNWMDQNLAWTKQLGDAFLAQPAEVMEAVQRLRAKARAAGTLVDTPQQQVVVEDRTITIVPAQPEVIYVPYYDPAVVYLPRPVYYGSYYSSPFITFSPGFVAGFWLSHRLDWGSRRVCVVHYSDRERYWRDHHNDWHRPQVSRAVFADSSRYRTWAPRPSPTYTRRTNFVGHVDVATVRSAPVDHIPAARPGDFRSEATRRDNGNPPVERNNSANISAGSRRVHTPPPSPSVDIPAPAPTPRVRQFNTSPQPMPAPAQPQTTPNAGPSGRRHVESNSSGDSGPRSFHTPPAAQPSVSPAAPVTPPTRTVSPSAPAPTAAPAGPPPSASLRPARTQPDSAPAQAPAPAPRGERGRGRQQHEL